MAVIPNNVIFSLLSSLSFHNFNLCCYPFCLCCIFRPFMTIILFFLYSSLFATFYYPTEWTHSVIWGYNARGQLKSVFLTLFSNFPPLFLRIYKNYDTLCKWDTRYLTVIVCFGILPPLFHQQQQFSFFFFPFSAFWGKTWTIHLVSRVVHNPLWVTP